MLSGCQDAGLCRVYFRHSVGPLPRTPCLQQLCDNERSQTISRPLVPDVRKDLHLHELVSQSVRSSTLPLVSFQYKIPSTMYNIFVLECVFVVMFAPYPLRYEII